MIVPARTAVSLLSATYFFVTAIEAQNPEEYASRNHEETEKLTHGEGV